MATITLRKARTIISRALAKGREQGMKPLAVCVLDAGGHLRAFEREDGASNMRRPRQVCRRLVPAGRFALSPLRRVMGSA